MILSHRRMWRDAETEKAARATVAAVATDIAESDAPTVPPPREAPKAAQTTQRAQR